LFYYKGPHNCKKTAITHFCSCSRRGPQNCNKTSLQEWLIC